MFPPGPSGSAGQPGMPQLNRYQRREGLNEGGMVGRVCLFGCACVCVSMRKCCVSRGKTAYVSVRACEQILTRMSPASLPWRAHPRAAAAFALCRGHEGWESWRLGVLAPGLGVLAPGSPGGSASLGSSNRHAFLPLGEGCAPRRRAR